MRIPPTTLFLVAALVVLHCGAQPVTAYTTLGEPGDTYNIGGGWLVNGSANPPEPYVAEGFAFTPAVSGNLSQIRLAMGAGNGNLASDVANIYLAVNNNQNLPGGTMESFLNIPCTGYAGLDNPLTVLTSSVKPLLRSGTSYWIWVQAANAQADVAVNDNSLGVLASQAQSFAPFSWIARGSQSTFAFDVEVSLVPEPSMAALAALGAGVVAAHLPRRRNRQISAS
jgi:hypothetical protein